MEIYPQKVQLARDIIDQFIKDWKKDPYYYDNEFSIQAEIYMRIKKCLELLGQQIVQAFYVDSWVQEGYKDKQNWCRVSAEPYFYLDKKKIDHCHPDIVIWDDKPGVKEHTWYTNDNWPALWICEIKVNSKINTVKSENSNWDIKKMEQLIESKDVQYGCWLNFIYKLEPDNAENVEWEYDKKGKLWKINCYFPRLNPTK